MSNIKDLEFDLELKEPTSNENYQYNIDFYTKYINILEFNSGMGQLLFRN